MFVFRCWLLVGVCIQMQTKNEEEQERGATREEQERARREHIYTKKNNKTKTVHVIQAIERQENVRYVTQRERREEEETRSREEEEERRER